MYLDIILLLLLVLCMTIGVMRGVLSPLITFFSLFLSIWLVVLFLDPCLGELKELTHPWEGNFLVTLLHLINDYQPLDHRLISCTISAYSAA